MPKSVEIFFCYAREDEALRQGLEKQLRALKRQGVVDVWHDRMIEVGTEWERSIGPARIHLLLLGGHIRRRHAERVLQALSILSGKQWTCENVDDIRIYREHTMPFVLPYTMFVERKKSTREK